MIDSQTLTPLSDTQARKRFLDRYHSIRAWTNQICSVLSEEDVTPQSMPDASPAKWHMAHTTWFFETFVLEKVLENYEPLNAEYKVLFNSYYNSVGDQYLRPQRGFITRPCLKEVLAYREYVDQYMESLLLSDIVLDGKLNYILEIGLQHEQQHQELILTDIKHLFAHNPLYPIYREHSEQNATTQAVPLNWVVYNEGLRFIGHDTDAFAFDNECPKHRVYVHGFQFASRLVSNEEYLAFMQDKGYQRSELWLSDAWQLLKTQQWTCPLYWQQGEDGWYQFTLSGLKKIQANEPVCHISFYEADAYARWAGARLPTEFEWESVAQLLDAGAYERGHFLEGQRFHPSALEQESVEGVMHQVYGDVWEWTASPYTAYPGFRTPEGALAEYNGKFMSNQMVLRGGSCLTPKQHIRASYRNFFPVATRWQFSGIRLAKDLES